LGGLKHDGGSIALPALYVNTRPEIDAINNFFISNKAHLEQFDTPRRLC
jgi:hypothetical protein